MLPRNRFMLVAALIGLSVAGTVRAEETAYPEKCRANAMAMPGHFKGDAAKSPEMSSEMTDYQQAFGLGMRDMNTNMMAGMMQSDADVAFICGMIAHHMGAISMAETELSHGDDPEARDMAKRIIEAQRAEIETMKTWLERTGQ